jgi:hypothetical protein
MLTTVSWTDRLELFGICFTMQEEDRPPDADTLSPHVILLSVDASSARANGALRGRQYPPVSYPYPFCIVDLKFFKCRLATRYTIIQRVDQMRQQISGTQKSKVKCLFGKTRFFKIGH